MLALHPCDTVISELHMLLVPLLSTIEQTDEHSLMAGMHAGMLWHPKHLAKLLEDPFCLDFYATLLA